MKALIVISLLFVATNAMNEKLLQQLKEMLHDEGTKCIKEVSATEGDLKEIMDHKVPASPEGKCLIFCLYKFLNFQKADGSVDKEGTIETIKKLKPIDEELYNNAVTIHQNCAGKVPPMKDACLAAASISNCLIDESHTLGIKPGLFSL